jgi:two-component system OmpR family response regulator
VKRILIVDDDPSLANLMAITLRRGGFAVETAGSLASARLHPGPFDGIVADVRLPNGDGRHLREDWPQVPMLVISGAPVDDPAEVLDGALPFLAKPFHPAHLTDAVRQLVEAR